MVRRVLHGRRDADRRPRRPRRPRLRWGRWAGPPPLLLAATVLGFVVAPLVDEQPTAPVAQPTVVMRSGSSVSSLQPRIERGAQHSPSRAGQVSKGVRPVRLAPIDVGVASMNVWRRLSPTRMRADVRKLVRRDDVDVVGWQEVDGASALLHSIAGWSTRTFVHDGEPSEVAVSWRTREFRLVSARQVYVAPGVSWRRGSYPFGDRLVAVVTLEHRDTGRRLTVIDTHLPPHIENLDSLGHWAGTPNAGIARSQLEKVAHIWRQPDARWVVGTGDFNFDAKSDEAKRPPGGPVRTLGRSAISTYQKLGIPDAPTYPSNGRHIDYVWVAREGYESGAIELHGQRVLRGLNSDHNAVIARLRLS